MVVMATKLIWLCLPIVSQCFAIPTPHIQTANVQEQLQLDSVHQHRKAVGGDGKLFFLIMAKNGLPHEDLWTRFFNQGASTEYAVFVHCEDQQSCTSSIADKAVYQLVNTVKSKYCVDLVNPAQALMQAALHDTSCEPHPNDRFLLVSHNSVPVKPFGFVKHELFARNSSAVSFAEQYFVHGHYVYKTSQWVALNRKHATFYAADIMGLNKHYTKQPKNPYQGKGACLDEFYTLGTIFGQQEGSLADLLRNNNVELYPYMALDWYHKGYIDCCDFKTLTPGQSNPNDWQPIQAELVSFTEVSADIWQSSFEEGDSGPASFDSFSAHALTMLRESRFLFLRKVASSPVHMAKFIGENMTLPEAFQKYVFDT